MQESQDLSRLIGEIYDAALDPALWPAVLDGLAAFVGGSGAAILSKDATRGTGEIAQVVGIDPAFQRSYFEVYIKLDPASTGQFFAEIGEPIATADLIAWDEFVETRFYREWARPQGLVDFATIVVQKSATSAAMFGVFRHERHGVIDNEARRRMRLVAPHMRRSILIARLIDLKTAEAAMLADSLDGLGAAMFLVDARRRIVHGNVAGHRLLAEREPLRAVAGRLTATDADADRLLAGIFEGALGTRGIAVPLGGPASDPWLAHVLPLDSGARKQAGAGYAAAAAVFVHRASPDSVAPPEALARHYGLTPTELRVLLAIVEVGGVPAVAGALGIAETTVKTHLGRVFTKTATSRQTDLARLVAAFSSPLIG